MSDTNLNSIPNAAWLEKNLKDLISTPVKSICICAVGVNGDIYRDYYETAMVDKIAIAGIIQQDAMLDSMAAHGIIEYVDEEDMNTGGEEKE